MFSQITVADLNQDGRKPWDRDLTSKIKNARRLTAMTQDIEATNHADEYAEHGLDVGRAKKAKPVVSSLEKLIAQLAGAQVPPQRPAAAAAAPEPQEEEEEEEEQEQEEEVFEEVLPDEVYEYTDLLLRQGVKIDEQGVRDLVKITGILKKLDQPNRLRAYNRAVKSGNPFLAQFILGFLDKKPEPRAAKQDPIGEPHPDKKPTKKVGRNHTYRVRIDDAGVGHLGAVSIDTKTLTRDNVLIARVDGKIVYNGAVDSSFQKALFTQRFDPRSIYSKQAIKALKTLIQHSKLPVNERAARYQLAFHGKAGGSAMLFGGQITIVKNVSDLIPQLELALGEIRAGNNSAHLRNKASAMIDMLLSARKISSKEASALHMAVLNRPVR